MQTDAKDNDFELFAAGQDPLLARVAYLTRLLRSNMRELGLDKAVEQAAYVIPDARERLRYVVRMTEQAATQVLSAIEQAQPLQSAVNEQSEALQNLLEGAEGQGMDPLLRKQIEQYLDLTRNHAATTSGLLSEIMMAQSFQDLTGQVIAKMLALIDELENGLIMVLLENIPEQKREDLSGYLNGPQVNPKANAEAVTNQDQVDDLLSSLGL